MMIDIPVGGHTAEAYVARPSSGSGRGVLLFIDAIGLRPQIEQMADRIASWGYVVLAPNLFYRSGSAAETSPDGPLDADEARTAFFRAAMPRVDALTPDQTDADTDAWLAALRHLDGVSGPFGVIGYCMGARLATRAAGLHPDDVAACAGFHGGKVATAAPDSPHLALAGARAELLYGHADADPSMPPEDIARLQDAIDAAGLVGTQAVYLGAKHGFTMADTAMYREDAAERAFAETEALFARALR